MEYLDANDYVVRAKRIQDLLTRHKARLVDFPATDRTYLERYFLGALSAPDPNRYRCEQLKTEPTIEAMANRSYERLLAELNVPSSLPAR